jgi:hypothetical protein
VILLCYRTEGWCYNKNQNQKVTESWVEINVSLMKVIARTQQFARFGARGCPTIGHPGY